MNNLEKQYQTISDGWLQTYVNMEFADSDRILGLAIGGPQLQKVYKAMNNPVELNANLQRVLDMYERQFLNIFTVHSGQFIEC